MFQFTVYRTVTVWQVLLRDYAFTKIILPFYS